MPASVFKKCCELFSQPDSSSDDRRSGIKENELPYQTSFDFVYNDIPYPPPKKAEFTFIDLLQVLVDFALHFKIPVDVVFFLANGINMQKKHTRPTLVKYPTEI